MRRSARGRGLLAAALTGLLASGLVACTSSSDEVGAALPSAGAGALSGVVALEGEEPSEEPEPTSTGPTYATEPELVDASAPPLTSPGEPREVEGRSVLPEVALDAAVSPAGTELTVWLEGFTSVQASAPRPGEIGGDAVQFDVFVQNAGDEPFDLGTLVIGLEYGAGRTPAEDVITVDSRPLSGLAEPGVTLRGVFHFVAPESERDDVVVTVDLAGDVPTILFAGSIPGNQS